MRHEYFGEIAVSNDAESVELPAIESDRGPIEVEIETVDGALRHSDLDALADVCRARDAWATTAQSAFRARFEEFVRDALEVWCESDAAFASQFRPGASGADELTVDDVAPLYRLSTIRAFPEDDDEPIWFEFRLPDTMGIDYLICARFSAGGELLSLEMES